MMLAVMQPYIFPYIGYFHLLDAADKIIFYDDVNFIKGGWINRNKILLNGEEFLFTVPMEKVSQNKLINEIKPLIDDKFKSKFFNQLKSAYSKAPFYAIVSDVLKNVFDQKSITVVDLTINSILNVYKYVGSNLNYDRSSICSPTTRGLEKADRLIKITQDLGYNKYVNSIGGQTLYTKEYFLKKGIELFFVKSNEIKYPQLNHKFIPNLSIIDVMMFNDVDVIKSYFKEYRLI